MTNPFHNNKTLYQPLQRTRDLRLCRLASGLERCDNTFRPCPECLQNVGRFQETPGNAVVADATLYERECDLFHGVSSDRVGRYCLAIPALGFPSSATADLNPVASFSAGPVPQ